MAKFNLKKHATKSDMSESYPKRLSGQNSDRDYTVDSGKKVETIQGMLNPNRKEGINSPSTTIENLAEKSRAGTESTTVENQIGKRESYIPHRQHNDKSRGPIKPNDLLAESYDQKYYSRFASEQEAEDTEFWDRQIGVQLSGEKTTIVGQVPSKGSQLQNHPDRFKKVKIENGHIDPADSDNVLKKNREMIYASSLKDLDSRLFQIYYKAAKGNRELTSGEQKNVDAISLEKTKILTSFLG